MHHGFLILKGFQARRQLKGVHSQPIAAPSAVCSMRRSIPDLAERRKIVHLRGSICNVCGYSLRPALRVHHIVPVSLGGGDEESNLVLVCASCHSLIHHFATKAHDRKPLPKYLGNELSADALGRLRTLILKLQHARRESDRSRKTARAVTLDQAISKVADTGGFDDDEEASYRECLTAVLEAMPSEVSARCAYRLVRRGKYISINLMNYLIYVRRPTEILAAVPGTIAMCYFPIVLMPSGIFRTRRCGWFSNSHTLIASHSGLHTKSCSHFRATTGTSFARPA